MINSIKIGTRSSKLALYQANLVRENLNKKFPNIDYSIVEIKTKGDKIQDRNLDRSIDKGFFVKEIQDSLIEEKIDIAVHSLKDLPVENSSIIKTSAILERGNHKDVFLSRSKKKLSEFTKNEIIGTSSLRRKAQLLNINPNLTVKDIRGNVDTRIKKMINGEYDGLVMAAAGIERLGLEGYISEYLDVEIMLNAPGQGAIAIEINSDKSEIDEIICKINHEETERCTLLERSFMDKLGGGCNSPIAAFSSVNGDKICLIGAVLSLDGKVLIKDKAEANKNENVDLDNLLANKILENGGKELIKKFDFE